MRLLTILLLGIINTINSQKIEGVITSSKGDVIPFANVYSKNKKIGTTSDENGVFKLNITQKKITLVASAIGYLSETKNIIFTNTDNKQIDFVLTETDEILNQVTVTGTRTDKRKTNSPVIVNIISSETLADVEACNLSEGLKFQTGLRVETDCQTCSYTQLRMNGLAGGYSQILINGRPIFSPLTGLYGLEQIPTNMVERIEVVRGGGSALYGSSAIGGTVNVITKVPTRNNYSIGYTYQNIKGTSDHIINGNGTLVNTNKTLGATVFFNSRERGLFDANNDNFSELPSLTNLAFGGTIFYTPNNNEKLEVSFSKLYEYRYGGDMIETNPSLALQAEERTHNVYMSNIDYQKNFNNNKTSFIAYLASQFTDRDHYTGVRPDVGSPEDVNHLQNLPYGTSETTTLQGGIQLNHKIENFISGDNIITLGSEFIKDDVFDDIETYNYTVDQTTKNLGVFLQSDWEINSKWNLLAGVRYDNHTLNSLKIDKTQKQITNNVLSPRVSLLYKPFDKTQIRATWGTGFRAPQAFDTDLHIAFAGGGVSRIQLSDNLKRERSNSYTVSFNYDKPTEHYIYGFTIEGFYTQLNNAFVLENIGEDNFGELFEKRNGDKATVKGVTIESRFNYEGILQLETGFTLQESFNRTPVNYSTDLPTIKEFLRTPNTYGYATFSYEPNTKFNSAINLVYTGPMKVLHLASPENLLNDEYYKSPDFVELGFKSSYIFKLPKLKSNVEISGGVKNILDSYQTNFDTGKERDSNFIYGPANPRTFFIGLKFTNN
ncbi:TonB-dependent receptor [Tenacibaculum geojense]|uniref:TonB-dependent receptor domain-containing protein n=1 Tax=Tenacibaculum geojense TaxID=915352 RepID=A0ABW3JU31_9FLAO